MIRVSLDGFERARQALHELGAALSSGDLVTSVGAQITREALGVVQLLTPRQHHLRVRNRGSHPPIFRGWQSHVVSAQAGAFYEAAIRHRLTGSEGQVIVASLELGARLHTIAPKNAKVLSWTETGPQFRFRGRRTVAGVVGDALDDPGARGRVFARVVRHPGHQPFAMVKHTLEQMDRAMPGYAQLLAAKAGAIWAGGPAGVRAAVTR